MNLTSHWTLAPKEPLSGAFCFVYMAHVSPPSSAPSPHLTSSQPTLPNSSYSTQQHLQSINQSHLYIKTLSPQLTPFALLLYHLIQAHLIVHRLDHSNIHLSILFLHPSTTLQTSVVTRPILPTHHSRPSSTTLISSPSPTTGSTGTTRLRYHLTSTPSPSKSPLKASTSPPSHHGTAWSSAPPSTHTTSPAPSPMLSPSVE